jgi:hypothetical protein
MPTNTPPPLPQPDPLPQPAAIRTFFLKPQRSYTFEELRELFSELIASAAVEWRDDPTPSWSDVALAVFTFVPAAYLEDALGDEAGRVLPSGYRTETVRLRLPKHTLADLDEKAREHGRPDIAAEIENQYGRGDKPIEPW